VAAGFPAIDRGFERECVNCFVHPRKCSGTAVAPSIGMAVVPYVAGGVVGLTLLNTSEVENLGLTSNETFLTANADGGVTRPLSTGAVRAAKSPRQ
jgi:hypothetical protein